MSTILEELANRYQQLYLTPGDEEQYQDIIRKGKKAQTQSLAHFKTHPKDSLTWEDTPAGKVQVVYLYERSDFELFLQIMAEKCQPVAIPPTQGAVILDGVVNWDKIHAHQSSYTLKCFVTGTPSDWPAELKRFTSDKRNYTDALIVLSHGPYSAISAEAVDMPESTWLEKSLDIRKYHECTHFICRRLYPEKIDPVWDELVADAVGIRAAFGTYRPELAELFLGIRDGAYVGGRLENYVEAPQLPARASYCHDIIRRIQELSEANAALTPYQFALLVEERKEQWEGATPTCKNIS